MGELGMASDHITTLDLGFGSFDFCRNVVVGEIREGATINADHALELMSFGIEYYKDVTSVVYISNRKHSYSIDPTLHLETGKIFPKLAGYGIVYYEERSLQVARLEQRFVPYPSELFVTLEAAIAWAVQCVEKAEKVRTKPLESPR